MSKEFHVGNGCYVDVEDYRRIQKHCRELRKENNILKQSLAREQSINAVLIGRYETSLNEASILQSQSQKRIADLEREMKNCSQEIGFLQDQLDLRTQEVNDKEAELLSMHFQIKKLESSILSIQLESQCEIEFLNHNITELELRYLEAERYSERIANRQKGSELLFTAHPTELRDEQKKAGLLESKKVSQKLALFEGYIKLVFSKVNEYFDAWLRKNQGDYCVHGDSDRSLTLSLSSELSLLSNICECRFDEVWDPFLSKLATLLAWGENMKGEMQKMSKQIRDLEILLNQTKEQLSVEKSRAKEEAEDLTQEMAELRYQITGLLEEECKHRSAIEHASLRRIQELEQEVCKLKVKDTEAFRTSSEPHVFPKLNLAENEDTRKETIGYRNAHSKEQCNHGSCVSRGDHSYGCGDNGNPGGGVDVSSESCDSWTLVVRQDQHIDCELLTVNNDLHIC